MTRVLLVTQLDPAEHAVYGALHTNGCEVETYDASVDTVRYIERCQVVLADEVSHTEVATLLGGLPIVVLSDQATIRGAVRAMRAGATDYLELPVSDDELMASIERAVSTPPSLPKSESKSDALEIVGSSPVILELKERIGKVAATRTPVLLYGESGTGKELFARAIHAASDRRHKPMITINCAAIPANLLEVELFGRDPELNQDPRDRSRGLIEAADGGTLFLDEIGEVPAEVQARLLRLLQVGEVRPVGGTQAFQVDVRIIGATHRDLTRLVDEQRFREDLFYRLNVVLLTLPPLKGRTEDILELAKWALQQCNQRLQKNIERISEAAEQYLAAYHWPGNVRELQNVIERAVILSDGEELTPELLAIELNQPPPLPLEPQEGGQDQTSLEDYFVRFVLENEEHFTETELAEKLGISRKSLWERRQRLNIPRKRTKTRRPRRAEDTEES